MGASFTYQTYACGEVVRSVVVNFVDGCMILGGCKYSLYRLFYSKLGPREMNISFDRRVNWARL
jgi:hypothetical protein